MSMDNAAHVMRQPLLFTVEMAGQHRFAYTKYELDTGHAVWRWPDAPPLSSASGAATGGAAARTKEAVAPAGQLLDITV